MITNLLPRLKLYASIFYNTTQSYSFLLEIGVKIFYPTVFNPFGIWALTKGYGHMISKIDKSICFFAKRSYVLLKLQYRMPEAYDQEGGVNQEKRFSVAMQRYRYFTNNMISIPVEKI